MKICIMSTMIGVPWAGSEALWVAAAHTALDDGHELAVVTKRWPKIPPPVVDLQARGAKLFLRGANLNHRTGRIYERFIEPLPALVRWRPDVAYVNQGSFLELTARNDINRILRSFGVPYIVICHQNFENQCPAPDDASRRRMTTYFRGAHRVGFVARRNLESAETMLATDLPNACVVRNPVNITDLTPVPWPTAAEPQLACVARLDADHKGQDILFAMLGQEPWKSRAWTLRVYGDGRHRSFLIDLAKFRGVSGRVEFRGHVGDIRTVWAENHVQLMPSRCEGTPIALVEAMLCARPAVVTDIGGNAEWISEPRNGFVAEAPSLSSFGAAMERAWRARDSWEEIGLNAHRDAAEMYDPEPGRTIMQMLVEAVEAGTQSPDRESQDRTPAVNIPLTGSGFSHAK
jgi:L-malate glycosyltransferase